MRQRTEWEERSKFTSRLLERFSIKHNTLRLDWKTASRSKGEGWMKVVCSRVDHLFTCKYESTHLLVGLGHLLFTERLLSSPSHIFLISLVIPYYGYSSMTKSLAFVSYRISLVRLGSFQKVNNYVFQYLFYIDIRYNVFASKQVHCKMNATYALL